MKLKSIWSVLLFLLLTLGVWGEGGYGVNVKVDIRGMFKDDGLCSSCGPRELSYEIIINEEESIEDDLLSLSSTTEGEVYWGDLSSAVLKLGKEYEITFYLNCMKKVSWEISSQGPYAVMVDEEIQRSYHPIYNYSTCSNYSKTYKIRVTELEQSLGVAEFKYSDAIGIVDWKFGLGTFLDGSSAGYFQIFQENELPGDSGFLYPDDIWALEYTYSGSGLIDIEYTGTGNHIHKVRKENQLEVEVVGITDGYALVYRDLSSGTPVEFARYELKSEDISYEGGWGFSSVTYIPNNNPAKSTKYVYECYFPGWENPPEDWVYHYYAMPGVDIVDAYVMRDVENIRVSKCYYPLMQVEEQPCSGLPPEYCFYDNISTGQISYAVMELNSSDIFDEKEENSYWVESISDPYIGRLESRSTAFRDKNYLTSYTYNSEGRIDRVTHPDGSWTEYKYYANSSSDGGISGKLKSEYKPFKDETQISSTTIEKRYLYVNSWSSNTDNLDRTQGNISEVLNYQGTTLLGKTEYSYESGPENNRLTFEGKAYSINTVKRYANGAENGLVTVTKRFDNDLSTETLEDIPEYTYCRNKLISEESPDGQKVSMAYRRMSLTAGTGSGGELSLSRNAVAPHTGWETLEVRGTIYTEAGDPVDSVLGMPIDNIVLIPGVSTLTTRLGDHRYQLEESYLYMGETDGFVLISQSFRESTATGTLIEEVRTDGTNVVSVLSNEVVNHRVVQSTAPDGTITHYYYDYIGRVEYVLVEGSETGGVPHRLTHYDLTAMGDVEKSEVIGIDGSYSIGSTFDPEDYLANYSGERFITENEYDKGGRLTKTTKPCGAEVTIAYEKVPGTDEYRQSRIVENGQERIEKNYRSGEPESLTGTGVIPRYYDLSYDSNGYLLRKQTNATASGLPDYTNRYNWWKKDWLGRVLEEGAPTLSGEAVTSYTYYTDSDVDKQNFGKLARVEYPGMTADTVYGYGYMGEYSLTGLDVDGTLGIQTGSTDRISEQRSEVVKISDDYWLVSTSKAYLDGSSTPVVTGKQEVRLTGYDTANLIAESLSYGANGIYAGKEAVYQYPSSNKVVTKSYASGVTNPVETITYAGRQVSQTTAAGETVDTIYDVMGRVSMQEGLGSSGQIFAYQAGSTIVDKIYELRESSTQVLVKELEYDCETNQLLEEKNYLVKSSNPLDYESTKYAYNDRGQLTKMWGDNVKPVYYRYNEYGQRDRMATFHDYALNGADLSNFDLTPSGSTNDPITTKWAYDARTGLLSYSEDSEGHQTTNTYRSSDNRLEYVRNPRMTSSAQRTRMIYDSVTGELQKIDYNYANTADVSYTYDRLGRTKTVTDRFGTRSFEYNDIRSGAGTGMMGLSKETLPLGLKGLVIDYNVSDNGLWGQLLLKNGGETTTYFEQNYDSNSLDGRLSRITSRSLHGQIGHQIDYGYWNDSSIVDEVKMSGGARVFKQSRLRDAYRKHTDRYTNEIEGGAVLARYDYGYHDDDNQIESVGYTGRMFAGYGSTGTLETTYSYNAFNELTGAATVVNPGGSPVTLASRSFSMSYDDGGNRLSGFTPENDSDQYASRTHSSTRWLSGEDPTTNWTGYRIGGTGSYSVVSNPGGGDYFENSFTVSNSSANYTGMAWVQSGSEEIAEGIHVRKGTESFGYDHAGNLTADAVFGYEYDAANRLKAIVYPDGYRKEFYYDYQSRRAEEKMIDPGDSTVYRRIYIYDGNRIIAEVDPDKSGEAMFVKTYTWGLDIGSTLGSASGNIGGLCAIDNWVSAEQYQVGYDGRGNVSLLVNAKTGTLEAEVEYSAFGELVRTTGKWRETPFLYSTKWHLDYGPQSGLLWPLHLYDYGLRVYDPSNGRFLNRDPIGDQGGSNLYAFVGNDPVNNWDYIGLFLGGECDDNFYDGTGYVRWVDCTFIQDMFDRWDAIVQMHERLGNTYAGSLPAHPGAYLRTGSAWGMGGGISFEMGESVRDKLGKEGSVTNVTRTVGFNVTYSTMPYDSQYFFSSWSTLYHSSTGEALNEEELKRITFDKDGRIVYKTSLDPDDKNKMGLGGIEEKRTREGFWMEKGVSQQIVGSSPGVYRERLFSLNLDPIKTVERVTPWIYSKRNDVPLLPPILDAIQSAIYMYDAKFVETIKTYERVYYLEININSGSIGIGDYIVPTGIYERTFHNTIYIPRMFLPNPPPSVIYDYDSKDGSVTVPYSNPMI